jgi:hypothetical protein
MTEGYVAIKAQTKVFSPMKYAVIKWNNFDVPSATYSACGGKIKTNGKRVFCEDHKPTKAQT